MDIGYPLIHQRTRKRNTEDVQDLEFHDGQKIHEAFKQYSIAILKEITRNFMSTSWIKSRIEIYGLIVQATSPIQDEIRKGIVEYTRLGERKKKRTGTSVGLEDRGVASTSREANHLDTFDGNAQQPALSDNTLLENNFMKPPSKQVIDDAIGDFIDRTSNLAMAVGACAVCARETNRAELIQCQLNLIPRPERLRPAVSHPAHDIFSGMLLHPAGVMDREVANVCMECCRALDSDKTPTYALANGLWIGAIPHELAFLTLPERLLIAKYFPAAYIIKLYPKKKGARYWDKRQMYSGLKGNVSTYQLDQGQIASMIDGTIMPQQVKILAATLGITFVGPKNLPDKCIPDIFRVRRSRVQTALEWLKENNPLFANITISAARLAELPENDVPYELHATTKLSTDVSTLYAEHEGYVPSQEVGDDQPEEGKFHLLSNACEFKRTSQSTTRARLRSQSLKWTRLPRAPPS